MNKHKIALVSALSLIIFIICDILMSGNSADLLKTIIIAIILYVGFNVLGYIRWKFAYHFLGVIIGIYTLSLFVIINTMFRSPDVPALHRFGAILIAIIGVIVNLFWYRLAWPRIKNDYVRIVKRNIKKK
ncbi:MULTISPECIES: hypothetical protein [Apilactobacillus]|uniref:Uncharacterized protein n=2 Tax=Apilactobacillus TaxID=2767877 RepID=A0A2S2JL37_9LACO|nr:MULTISPECIES: hypothetical protein [Apilactobacillus]TPR14866.1 hypothetical protein DYZ97_01655 [Apilactobacillus timberlakei]TPR15836.1 hypothetical protein DY052_04455 [Apilactobacillus timberlakei]TPR16197.1 hypothetical protein DY048_01670 [Apilactobacillus timberlakei]TPR18133.1 hypothetical protein DYZ95_02195 [Apilactobacillus timberlakei]TPR41123.1 hypothetical protein DY121_01565 [Apilactobacillus micheneri]